jgi:hypothetical protein
MASTYLTRSLSSTSTSWTFSAWVKRGSNLGVTNYFISWGNSGTDATGIGFNTSDKFQYYSEDNPSNINAVTNAVYRDNSGWYNFVCSCNAGAITLYTNGETVGSTTGGNALDTSTMQIGKWVTSAYYHDGSMSHVHFIDGTAYDATAFGEYDANGVWKIKTSPSVTYGTNGFFILKNGNSVTDQSGNSNNFTVAGGTLTNTEDSPSNVFATMNPLDNYWSTSTYENGNNTVTSANNGYSYSTSTLGVNTGKFYWECKWSAQPTGSSNKFLIGIAKRPAPSSTTWLGSEAYTYGYMGSDGNVKVSGGNATGSVATTYAVGDIISVALDLDNNKIHFAKNGSYTNSSNPSANSGGITITAPDSTTGDSGFYFAGFGDGEGSLQETGQFNFGNGYFGTTAVSSAGTNASGIGIFEYDVPTGFTSLSTKGLNL